MMRLWTESYVKRAPVATSATLSFVVHAAIIAAWVSVTLPPPSLPADGLANRPVYIPPPDRLPGQEGARESVHYIDLTRDGLGKGDGPRLMGEAKPTVPDETVGRQFADSLTAPPTAPVAAPQDSVFSVLDVDTAVVRSASSAAPAYPLKLLQAHIQGAVAARYVVDTTGFADMTSFEVIRATNPEFVDAVRDALPYMRFKPAKIGPIKVRQLVEQQFTFKINDTVVATPKAQKPGRP
jgi:outer membrane biosynthesis protein TonB